MWSRIFLATVVSSIRSDEAHRSIHERDIARYDNRRRNAKTRLDVLLFGTAAQVHLMERGAWPSSAVDLVADGLLAGALVDALEGSPLAISVDGADLVVCAQMCTDADCARPEIVSSRFRIPTSR